MTPGQQLTGHKPNSILRDKALPGASIQGGQVWKAEWEQRDSDSTHKLSTSSDQGKGAGCSGSQCPDGAVGWAQQDSSESPLETEKAGLQVGQTEGLQHSGLLAGYGVILPSEPWFLLFYLSLDVA
jgi:hypothetical protein